MWVVFVTQILCRFNVCCKLYHVAVWVPEVDGLDKAVITNAAMLDALTSGKIQHCLLYTSPSPRDLSTSRMPSSA